MALAIHLTLITKNRSVSFQQARFKVYMFGVIFMSLETENHMSLSPLCRDHKTVYVGDGRGRIFSWMVTDQPGRVAADHWVKDEGVESCPVCNVRFFFAERRHHCRNCGKVFCAR